MLRIRDADERDVFRHDRGGQGRVDAVCHLEAGLAEVHLRRVLDRLLRLHGAERDHLGNLVLTPALGGVGDHLAAAAVVKVNINIGRGRTLRVEESLEEQAVFHRVDVGDGQRVGHKCTSRRATARPDADAHLTRVLNQLRDDEEVGRVALHVDDVDLVFRALEVLLWDLAAVETRLEPALNLLAQPARRRLAFRHVRDWHAIVRVVLPKLAVIADALGNPQRVVAAVRHGGVPNLAHLLRGLDVVARAVELEAIRVHHRLTGLHAQHRLVRGRLGFQDVVAVVGHQRGQVQCFADAQQVVADTALDVEPVVHKLKEEVVPPVNVLPHRGSLQGLVVLAQAQARLHVARRAASGGDNAVRVLGDELCVHAGPLAQLSLVGGEGRQLEQVVQSRGIFRQHGLVEVGTGRGDVVALLVRGAPQLALLVKTRRRGHVGFDADDRLYASVDHAPVESVGAEHVAVVRHAHSRHALADHFIGQQVHLGHAVQHGKLGVVVEVDEGGVFGHAGHLNPTQETAKPP